MKNLCIDVLGIDEFDEKVFSENIKEIFIIGEDTVEFVFYNDTKVQKHWKSKSRKDWWTDENRRDWSNRWKSKVSRPKIKGSVNLLVSLIVVTVVEFIGDK